MISVLQFTIGLYFWKPKKVFLSMNQILEQIYKIGIIPVIAIDDPDKAVPLAKALVKGDML